jgi:hypothetical protein
MVLPSDTPTLLAALHSVFFYGLPVVAYIDPSSGGMLFYLLAFILSAASGVIIFFSRYLRVFFARAKRFWRDMSGGKK